MMSFSLPRRHMSPPPSSRPRRPPLDASLQNHTFDSTLKSMPDWLFDQPLETNLPSMYNPSSQPGMLEPLQSDHGHSSRLVQHVPPHDHLSPPPSASAPAAAIHRNNGHRQPLGRQHRSLLPPMSRCAKPSYPLHHGVAVPPKGPNSYPVCACAAPKTIIRPNDKRKQDQERREEPKEERQKESVEGERGPKVYSRQCRESSLGLTLGRIRTNGHRMEGRKPIALPKDSSDRTKKAGIGRSNPSPPSREDARILRQQEHLKHHHARSKPSSYGCARRSKSPDRRAKSPEHRCRNTAVIETCPNDRVEPSMSRPLSPQRSQARYVSPRRRSPPDESYDHKKVLRYNEFHEMRKQERERRDLPRVVDVSAVVITNQSGKKVSGHRRSNSPRRRWFGRQEQSSVERSADCPISSSSSSGREKESRRWLRCGQSDARRVVVPALETRKHQSGQQEENVTLTLSTSPKIPASIASITQDNEGRKKSEIDNDHIQEPAVMKPKAKAKGEIFPMKNAVSQQQKATKLTTIQAKGAMQSMKRRAEQRARDQHGFVPFWKESVQESKLQLGNETFEEDSYFYEEESAQISAVSVNMGSLLDGVLDMLDFVGGKLGSPFGVSNEPLPLKLQEEVGREPLPLKLQEEVGRERKEIQNEEIEEEGEEVVDGFPVDIDVGVTNHCTQASGLTTISPTTSSHMTSPPSANNITSGMLSIPIIPIVDDHQGDEVSHSALKSAVEKLNVACDATNSMVSNTDTRTMTSTMPKQMSSVQEEILIIASALSSTSTSTCPSAGTSTASSFASSVCKSSDSEADSSSTMSYVEKQDQEMEKDPLLNIEMKRNEKKGTSAWETVPWSQSSSIPRTIGPCDIANKYDYDDDDDDDDDDGDDDTVTASWNHRRSCTNGWFMNALFFSGNGEDDLDKNKEDRDDELMLTKDEHKDDYSNKQDDDEEEDDEEEEKGGEDKEEEDKEEEKGSTSRDGERTIFDDSRKTTSSIPTTPTLPTKPTTPDNNVSPLWVDNSIAKAFTGSFDLLYPPSLKDTVHPQQNSAPDDGLGGKESTFPHLCGRSPSPRNSIHLVSQSPATDSLQEGLEEGYAIGSSRTIAV